MSDDVITPSADHGMIEAIYWKPEIRWVFDQLRILSLIRFTWAVSELHASSRCGTRVGRLLVFTGTVMTSRTARGQGIVHEGSYDPAVTLGYPQTLAPVPEAVVATGRQLQVPFGSRDETVVRALPGITAVAVLEVSVAR